MIYLLRFRFHYVHHCSTKKKIEFHLKTRFSTALWLAALCSNSIMHTNTFPTLINRKIQYTKVELDIQSISSGLSTFLSHLLHALAVVLVLILTNYCPIGEVYLYLGKTLGQTLCSSPTLLTKTNTTNL